MYTPSLEVVKSMAGKGNLVPVFRSINADLETPVSAYLKVARPPYSFLLESVAGGERIGRYSFIGTDPYDVIKTGPGQPGGQVDPLNSVQAELDKYQLVLIPRFAAPWLRRGGRYYSCQKPGSHREIGLQGVLPTVHGRRPGRPRLRLVDPDFGYVTTRKRGDAFSRVYRE